MNCLLEVLIERGGGGRKKNRQNRKHLKKLSVLEFPQKIGNIGVNFGTLCGECNCSMIIQYQQV